MVWVTDVGVGNDTKSHLYLQRARLGDTAALKPAMKMLEVPAEDSLVGPGMFSPTELLA